MKNKNTIPSNFFEEVISERKEAEKNKDKKKKSQKEINKKILVLDSLKNVKQIIINK